MNVGQVCVGNHVVGTNAGMDAVMTDAIASGTHPGDVGSEATANAPGGSPGEAVTFQKLKIPMQAVRLVVHHYMDRPDTIMFMLSMVMARVFLAWIERYETITLLVLCVMALTTVLVAMVGLYAKACLYELQLQAATHPPAEAWKRGRMEGQANWYRLVDDFMRTVLNVMFWMIMEMGGSFMDGMVNEGEQALAFVVPFTVLFGFRGIMLVLNPRHLPFARHPRQQ